LLSRNRLLSACNLRNLSTETQPQQNELQNVKSPQKDKLYSRLEVELKGIEPEVMYSFAWYAVTAAQHLGIDVGKW
jgi:small subunit ribosomal protein S10